MSIDAPLVTKVSAALRAGTAQFETLSLIEFRDLYNRLAGSPDLKDLGWCIVLMGDQAFAEPLGRRTTSLLVQNGGKYLAGSDFSFMVNERDRVLGSTEGRYRFWQFLKDVGGVGRLLGVGVVFVLLTLLFFVVVPFSAQAVVSQALLSALSIFITIFALFVLSVNTEREAGYLASGRFRKLAESDRHIAVIGLSALALAVTGVGFIASVGESPIAWQRGVGAALTAATSVLSGVSFWLVIDYHFSRRHEMTERLMAQALMKQVQLQAQAASTPGQVKLVTSAPTQAK